MFKINAAPLFKRGRLAVWLLKEIPLGVRRRGIALDVKGAFLPHVLDISEWQVATDVRVGENEPRFVACVAWTDLQPSLPVPRGCDTMLSAHWGQDRDADGVCTICNADDSMRCDTVAHNASAPTALRLPSLEGWVDDALQPLVPLHPRTVTRDGDVGRDRVLAAAMSSGFFGERHPPATAEMRAAWTRELRRRVQTSEECERNRVLVDRAFEEWE